LKLLIVLTLALMILGSSAQAFGGPGSVVVDIVGSKADNTKIESSAADNVVLEIVGSEANNTLVAQPAKKDSKCNHLICPPLGFPEPNCPEFKCPEPICPPIEDGKKIECKSKCYPWDSMHLGVDAWYDTFWYMDRPNMPKWPMV